MTALFLFTILRECHAGVAVVLIVEEWSNDSYCPVKRMPIVPVVSLMGRVDSEVYVCSWACISFLRDDSCSYSVFTFSKRIVMAAVFLSQ
jgi:hypothetical protein